LNLRTITLAALGLATALLQQAALAQPLPDGRSVLTLKEALGMARRNPPSVMAAIARMRAAEAQIDVARASLKPSVGASFGASLSAIQTRILYGESTIPPGLVFPGIVPTAALDGSLALRWPVADFGRTRLTVSALKQAHRGASADVESTESEAMLQVAAAYFTVLSDNELVVQNRETVRKRMREAELSQALVRSGARAPFEQIRAEVALEAARTDLVLAEGAARRDVVALASALGLQPAQEFLLSTPESYAADADEARAIEAAVRARPQLKAARARLEQAKYQLAAAQASYRPLVSLNGSFGGRYANRVRSDAVIALGGASAVLSVPLYDPAVTAAVRALEAEVARADAAFQQQSLNVRTEAVQATTTLSTARAILAQTERVAEVAATAIAQAEGRYQSGTSPLVELLDAQAADVLARVGVVRARLDVALATVQLLASTGQLDELLTRL
jgi:outer membrane protein TolC